ncbi:MAG: methyltransferase type 11 [Parcubacteria group bacterium Gr01-1014_3]|nr:MAG: methyltransferase type 11 [Parcubacteria group bacterium Gr01-1014_3]
MDNRVKFKKQPIRHIDGRPLFIPDSGYEAMRSDLHTGFINKLKTNLKKIPWLYSFIFYFIAPALFLGKQPKHIFSLTPKNGLVVEIGSGNRRIHPEIVNVDIHPWSMVDILADAHDLPFAENSVDGIVLSWVLEHMHDPVKVAAEINRALKPGGYLYLTTNFITPYHPSPKDHYRWTADGLRTLFKDFEMVEIGPDVGPTCALLSVFQEWVALALSFNNKTMKDFLWISMVILTSPLKVLDYLFIHYQSAETITAGFYLIAKKK